MDREAYEARQEKWDRYYIELAKFHSQRSKDPSTKVGAVVVDYNNRVVGMGYNGFPPGVADTEERYNNRELKYKLVVHAEVNAIITAGDKARGSTLYVWPSFALPPICNECCKVAITAGIADIVGYQADTDIERAARWAESISISKMLCDEAGIYYRGWKE